MVKLIVLSHNGESRTVNTNAITQDTVVSGANIAKVCRKTKPATAIGTYEWKSLVLTLWGWKEGKAGTENKHEMPPPYDEVLLFGDSILIASQDDKVEDFTNDQYLEFYNSAFKGFEDLEDSEEEEEEEDEEDIDGDMEEEVEPNDVDEPEAEEEEEEEEEEEAEEAEAEEAEADAEDLDDDCYDDGEDGGGGKRRAPRRRAAQTPDNRRIDMGLRSRIKIPSPLGKRAPKWQSAPELNAEEY